MNRSISRTGIYIYVPFKDAAQLLTHRSSNNAKLGDMLVLVYKEVSWEQKIGSKALFKAQIYHKREF